MQIDPKLKEFGSPILAGKIDQVNAEGSIGKAARKYGWDENNFRKARKRAEIKAAARGYSPDHDMTKTVAPGFAVKGTSTLYNDEGNISAQWVKTQREQQDIMEAYTAAVEEIVQGIKPVRPTKSKGKHDSDLLTNYTLTDIHVGMYAYAPETGDDWDVHIARQCIMDAFGKLVDGSPASEVAIFNQLGDFAHWDGLEAVTPMNRHILDADTRFDMLAELSLQIHIDIVELLKQKHKKVIVVVCEGNHDMASSVWIRKALKYLYQNEPRVEVDDTSFPFYAYLHGEVMLGYHHGHRKANKLLPALFASEPRYRRMWGKARITYVHTGHLHHTEKMADEHGGAIVERHPTLAARDAYATTHGFTSWRAAHAITYDKTGGEESRKTVTPRYMNQEDEAWQDSSA